MRGKDYTAEQPFQQHRITPAYAGKRFSAMVYNRYRGDHPRLCGEKFWVSGFSLTSVGSPPPMRGKESAGDDKQLRVRITPAYAGKSIQLSSYGQEDWDHPRLCGEKSTPPDQGGFKRGSPPPMRGKDNQFRCSNCEIRITPAYAGKRSRQYASAVLFRDHPRLCGEKRQNQSNITQSGGSPPPMRGKDTPAGAASPPAGITPAYAGKSHLFFLLSGFVGGSPPPMRGKVRKAV